MTLFQAPILTTGAHHSAQQFRMLVRDLARGNEGITEGDDLKVAALDTPGAGVQVADGSGIVRSKANAFGGSYAVCNIGTATVDVASTGGTPRSDMVVLRVLDPEYEGALDPAVDPVMFFDVISDVGSTATAVPAGYTAIPLARIDLPASTSTITAGMITDIRQVANPRRETSILTFSPTGALVELSGTSGATQYWSNVPGWNVAIPAWATKAKIVLTAGGLRYSTGYVVGYFLAGFGSSLALQKVNLDDNTTGTRRATVVVADTLTLPDAYRGTTQLLRPRLNLLAENLGKVGADAALTLIAQIEFDEAPR